MQKARFLIPLNMAENFSELKWKCDAAGQPICLGRSGDSGEFSQVNYNFCNDLGDRMPRPNCGNSRRKYKPLVLNVSNIRAEGRKLGLTARSINQAVKLYPFRYKLAREAEKNGIQINNPNDIYEVIYKYNMATAPENFEGVWSETQNSAQRPELGGWYRAEEGAFKNGEDIFTEVSLSSALNNAIKNTSLDVEKYIKTVTHQPELFDVSTIVDAASSLVDFFTQLFTPNPTENFLQLSKAYLEMTERFIRETNAKLQAEGKQAAIIFWNEKEAILKRVYDSLKPHKGYNPSQEILLQAQELQRRLSIELGATTTGTGTTGTGRPAQGPGQGPAIPKTGLDVGALIQDNLMLIIIAVAAIFLLRK